MFNSNNPHGQYDHHTEWSGASVIAEWINQIINEENLSFGKARVEKRGIDGKRPDCVLYEDYNSIKTALVIEFKLPYFDPFDEDDLKEPARSRQVKESLHISLLLILEL